MRAPSKPLVISVSVYLKDRRQEGFKQQLRRRLEAARLSLRTVLKTYGAVPASVRGGNGEAYNAHNPYSPYPGGSDTGMGFSYLRMIHVASTAWTGLALMSKTVETDPAWAGANPMQLTGNLPAGDNYCLPHQEIPESSISDKSCMWK
eukprot:Skav213953  [mRNA]  locus=scaffold1979:175439:176421:- [translate_table: standard]